MPVDSLERLVPEQLKPHEVTGQLTLQLHMERYEFAATQSQPGRILDIACGVGYGTEILFQGNSQNTEGDWGGLFGREYTICLWALWSTRNTLCLCRCHGLSGRTGVRHDCLA